MNCLFCSILNGDVPAEIITDDGDILAFRDISPQAPVHILIIPKEHISTLNELEERSDQMIGKLVRSAAEIARREGIDESGYRTVFNCNRDGGQAVYHVHLHLLGGRKLNWPPG